MERIKESYRLYLEGAVRPSEISKNKKALLRAYFCFEEPLWHPALAVPALCLLALFLWFHHLAPVEREMTTPAVLSAPAPTREPISPSVVEVRRASSRVGQVMIFHNWEGGLPVTIVWVFAEKGLQ